MATRTYTKSALLEAWAAQPASVRGIVMMCVSTVAFSAMHALVRFVSQDLPPVQVAFFRNLFLDLPHHAKVRLARLDGELIGGSFLLCYHRTIISKQAVVKPEHARTGLGKGLVWSTLNWGKDAGYDFLNLGISLESQAAVKSFKEGFGAVSRSLSSYVLPLGTEPPSYEDLYEGYGLAKQVWRKMPLPATKLAGAVLTRWFC